MSINDPQWGNSHRPEQKEPEQVPDSTGTAPVQPEDGQQDAPTLKTPNAPQKPVPPPEGPPDLEELWRQMVYKIRCRLARLRGQKLPPSPEPLALPAPAAQRGNDGVPQAGWQALSLRSWLIGVLLIIGAWLMSGFYLVDTPQRGVLSRFGRIVAIEDPGWHWRWPAPIDSVRLINVTADRTLEIGLSMQTAQKGQRQSQGLMLTADGSLAGVAYAVMYQVTDPVAYLSRANEPADLIALLAETSVREAVAQQSLSILLATADSQTAAMGASLLQTALASLQAAVAPLKLGVEIKGLAIREVQLPTPVQQAMKASEREIQARMKASRDAQAVATDNMIKARKLAMTLQDQSIDYAQALAVQRQMLQTVSEKTDTAQALKILAENSARWRTQFPLIFATAAMLQERVQPAVRGPQAGSDASTSTNADSASVQGADRWRDRERMRSRERIDRSGSSL